jgi:hypothetical protein
VRAVSAASCSRAALALLLACLCGCAAQPAVVMPERSSEDRRLALEEPQALIGAEAAVDELARGEDCQGACEAGARVCGLSERICDIAARHPGDDELEGRCADGRARCRGARERLAACGCAP